MKSAAEIARKQRYMTLLRKVKQNQSLTPTEIKELDKYEKQMPKKIPKKTSKKTSKKRKAKAKGRNKSLPISELRVRDLGFGCDNLIEAQGQCDLDISLVDVFDAHPKLQTAWTRGQFLKHLQRLAGTAVSVSEAAKALGMIGQELRDLLDNDQEVGELWNNARIDTLIIIKTAVMESAKEGNAAAIKQIEQLLRREVANTGTADFDHITIAQLVEQTGKTRQTVHDWHKKYGLSRNSDKTFNLSVFLKWFEDFTIEKFSKQPGSKLIGAGNPLQEAKAQQLQMILAEQRGQLLKRDEVITGLLARHQNLTNAFFKKAEDLARLCHLQPIDKISKILGKSFSEICMNLTEVPEQLRLPKDIETKLVELLAELNPEDNGM